MRTFSIANDNRFVLIASGLGDDSSGGGLFMAQDRGVVAIDRISTTGITHTDTTLSRVLRCRSDAPASLEILTYDRRGVSRYLRIDGWNDPHDLVHTNGEYIVVCTSQNSVIWIADDGHIVRTITLPGAGDAWHVNSIFVHEGRIYASAFGTFTRDREWSSEQLAGRGLIFDLENLEPILSGLHCPHNPRFIDGRWYVCNSGSNEFLAFADINEPPVLRVELGGFTRGVAFSDEYIFVGVSATRHQQSTSRAHIAVLRRSDWSITERIEMPISEIYDIVLVAQEMVPALHTGFNTNTSRVAESDQNFLFSALGIENARRIWAVADPLLPPECCVTLSGTLPDRVTCDERFDLNVHLVNTSDAFLVSAPPHPTRLSYKWRDPETGTFPDDSSARRTALRRSVPPRGAGDQTVQIIAPKRPGIYALTITLVQDGVAWFDDLLDSNCLRGIVIVEPSNALG